MLLSCSLISFILGENEGYPKLLKLSWRVDKVNMYSVYLNIANFDGDMILTFHL